MAGKPAVDTHQNIWGCHCCNIGTALPTWPDNDPGLAVELNALLSKLSFINNNLQKPRSSGVLQLFITKVPIEIVANRSIEKTVDYQFGVVTHVKVEMKMTAHHFNPILSRCNELCTQGA